MRYDVVLDVAGGRAWSAYRRVIGRGGTLVIVGAMKGTRAFGPLGHVVRIRLASLGSGRRVVFFIASYNHADMATLGTLMEEGKLTPAVDRTFDLREISAAMDYLGEGHARAKVVVTLPA
jgi:NADPH:quinone reductase-like Zn-dependent oxidoreductase